MKDYKGNAHKCLMAKSVVDDEEQQASLRKIKVTPWVNPPLFTPTPSSDEFLDVEDDNDEDDINDPLFEKMSKFMSFLKGKKLTMFRMLMEMVSKHTITIKELKTLVTEEKEKYEILKWKVQYEEARNDELCVKIGTNNDLHAKKLCLLEKG